jgi:hypothetical protein
VLVAGAIALVGASWLGAAANAAQYPPTAEAILLLDGTQGAPHDGFNMQIDTNGFSNPGGTIVDTHMFCVQSNVHYRCGIGANDLIRVQGAPSDVGLSNAVANELAWLITNRGGYNDNETQYAIWCLTNPGEMGAVGASDQLCHDAQSHAVPLVPALTLSPLGPTAVEAGTTLHFTLATDAPDVTLAVDDGGALPTLCGTAPDNAHAHLTGAVLSQDAPAVLSNFELCLDRSHLGAADVTVNLSASLAATATNLNVWVHPTAPSQCQGLLDASTTPTRVTASLATDWHDSSIGGSGGSTTTVAPTTTTSTSTTIAPTTSTEAPVNGQGSTTPPSSPVGGLAATGSDSASLARLGILAALFGGALLVGTRRSRLLGRHPSR